MKSEVDLELQSNSRSMCCGVKINYLLYKSIVNRVYKSSKSSNLKASATFAASGAGAGGAGAGGAGAGAAAGAPRAGGAGGDA